MVATTTLSLINIKSKNKAQEQLEPVDETAVWCVGKDARPQEGLHNRGASRRHRVVAPLWFDGLKERRKKSDPSWDTYHRGTFGAWLGVVAMWFICWFGLTVGTWEICEVLARGSRELVLSSAESDQSSVVG